MALSRRRSNGLDAWPGYVDALSTLLMVIIFVLLVFVLAQAFLSVALSNRDQALARLNGQLASVTAALGSERSHGAELARNAVQLNQELAANRAAAADAAAQLEQARRDLTAGQQARDAALADRGALAAKLADAAVQTDAAAARAATLTDQIGALHAQLDALDRSGAEKDARIADLGAQLNAALASKLAELQHYRSEFFGRLRDVLANRPGIRIVGDRFVFQSEVLFPAGSADLSEAGSGELKTLAATLTGIARDIPKDLPWVLRVDGHADRQVVTHGFASNWELSAQRAINVLKNLQANGVPAGHLAATAFGDQQPIDAADTPDAYAHNRRIEFRLTDR